MKNCELFVAYGSDEGNNKTFQDYQHLPALNDTTLGIMYFCLSYTPDI